MPAFDAILFDLDGTLADTRQDLVQSVNAALLRFGREPLDTATVTAYIGDGARELIHRSLGPSADQETVEEEQARAAPDKVRLVKVQAAAKARLEARPAIRLMNGRKRRFSLHTIRA